MSEREKDTRGERYADDVIDERPKEVLFDVAHGGASDEQRVRAGGKAVADKDDVRAFHGGVAASADRHAHVRLRQGGGVVDPVADHEALKSRFLQVFYLRRLVARQYLSDDFAYPRPFCDRAGGKLVVAREHNGAHAHFFQLAADLFRAVFERVGDPDHPDRPAAYGDIDHALALPLHFQRVLFEGGDVRAALEHESFPARERLFPLYLAHKSRTAHVHRLFGFERLYTPFFDFAQNGERERMGGAFFERRRRGEHEPLISFHVRHARSARGQRPRLIEDDAVHARRLLQRLGVFEEHAAPRRPARPRDDGGGGGKSQRAGAGDDQHRHEYLHAKCRRMPRRAPDDGGEDRDRHDRGHEHARYLVGELGYRRF